MTDPAARRFAPSPLIALAAAAGLLAAPRADAAPCNAGVCIASVTVQSCDDGTMAVDPDPIDVPAPHLMVWNLATPGYSFARLGIVISGGGFSPDPGISPNGKRFSVRNAHTDLRRDIKYLVRVVRDSDGKTCAPYDPIINNH